jgi:hypothetical protein
LHRGRTCSIDLLLAVDGGKELTFQDEAEPRLI